MIDAARDIAVETGARLMERFGRLSGLEVQRLGRRDVVTVADREAEEFITRSLAELDPDIPVLGEESARLMQSDGVAPSGPLWIVDPLDGTVNFVQGIPIFAVSIGLVEDGKPQLGVVHLPALGQTFYGAPGSGCFEGLRPTSVSVTPLLREAIVGTGFSYERNAYEDDNLDNVQQIALRARGLRRMGAAAVDLAYVASGRLDGFWELHLKPWDVAAGAALILAAGGRVTDQRGGDDWLYGRNIVASNSLIHERLRTALVPLKAL